MGKIWIGTSGYNYRYWKNIFYPNGTPVNKWLNYYSGHFNSVEINATFYGNFAKKVFETWRATTDDDFHFSVKGPGLITHRKKLNNIEAVLKKFTECAWGLEEKLAVILWQFPANFHCTAKTREKLKNFTGKLSGKIKHAFEFRHKSWFNEKIFRLMDKSGAGFVINDSSHFPSAETITGKFVYIRFHGPAGLYSSGYNSKDLKKWAEKIKKYLKDYDVFAYFNNDAEGLAVKNAKTLKILTEA
ncbi:hypothetical protein A3D05_03395 [Candidatus Gottesmanbacteria bacterium RIFCSPHIGHO2_02_FULL_40_24]|nr:MAG: hypothetical protein A3D05_03395 [Candidatus Gottesmanbacteria bacterium RIFCSPHIGHO2_02_FULL_40_24]OGG24719.1 MAG: hypothetical protein A3E42_01575 [Candidatus Gottesmanbacteria bacterium RIFCSPHIGHO2_12_FULL_40_13]